MKLTNNLEFCLKKNIYYIEILVYFLTIIMLFSTLSKSFIKYFKDEQDINNMIKIRIVMGESIGLALTFILAVEILKIYYIRNYTQLIIISSLVVLKLIITFFLQKETDNYKKDIYSNEKIKTDLN